MYSFRNDYSEGAHPKVLKALTDTNFEQTRGYGLDPRCQKARELIRGLCAAPEADVHFLVGGTQTNLLVIEAMLKPYEAVIAAHTGHVNVHETGAIEGTGHKVIAVPSPDGKLTPAMIESVPELHSDEHQVKPAMAYVSNTTETGTVYSKAELTALRQCCDEHGLLLFLDGARLGSALACGDMTLPDYAALADVFYIGGTKNGALCGEALVILNPALKEDFRFSIKQKGAMFAKGFLLGIQFKELFTDNLFYDLARHSNQMAAILRRGIEECGYAFDSESVSNQLFPILPDSILPKLSEEFLFSVQKKADNSHTVIRLVTSWATREEEAHRFVRLLKSLSGLKS